MLEGFLIGMAIASFIDLIIWFNDTNNKYHYRYDYNFLAYMFYQAFSNFMWGFILLFLYKVAVWVFS